MNWTVGVRMMVVVIVLMVMMADVKMRTRSMFTVSNRVGSMMRM